MRFRIPLAILTAFACVPALAQKVVLGKLGQALHSTGIYSRPSVRSRVYYQVKPYQYLVVQDLRRSSYLRVLLSNGDWGYVLADNVAQLPYTVTGERSPEPNLADGRYDVPLTSRSLAARAARDSINYLGTPYKWGGTNTATGIDCSAFVRMLFGQIGARLPRTAAQQALVGNPVTRLEDLRAGDRLYFWSYERKMIGHTGIYLGNGYFCHSLGGHGVTVSPLDKKWLAILVAARR